MGTTKTQPTNGHIVTDLTSEVMLEILSQKRQLYCNSRYAAELEYKIADRLKDDQAKKAQMEVLKRLEQAIELIDEEIAKIGD